MVLAGSHVFIHQITKSPLPQLNGELNVAGLPSISILAGFADGLTIGMQVISKPFGEETILMVDCAYEQTIEWHKKNPQI